MARDPERIERILSKIESIWKRSPDLRLGQLLVIADRDFESNMFYYEDESLEQSLDKLDNMYKSSTINIV